MQKLRPTVKRNLNLVSVQAWQQGYGKYFENNFGWYYPAIFHYDGERVNFYHPMSDFEYFKKVITEKLIHDDVLFTSLNKQFQENVSYLKSINEINETNIASVFEKISEVMMLYLFIVSDDFVKARPEAWESRIMSEGILYELDEKIEAYAKNISSTHAHVISFAELQERSFSEDELSQRVKEYILYNEELIVGISFADFCSQHDFYNPLAPEVSSASSIIQGTSAFGGKVSGMVKIVNNREDMSKVNMGDILVSVMTNVTLLSVIQKSSAFVTDEGGITCHAAIVAREMKKPCIIGTKIATQILKDGDIVEVDADNGVVKIIK